MIVEFHLKIITWHSITINDLDMTVGGYSITYIKQIENKLQKNIDSFLRLLFHLKHYSFT